MNGCNYTGFMGERIIAKLFPKLKVASIDDDKGGIDGYIGELRVQIKADHTIATKGNIYHEYWERTHEGQPWRKSPSSVDLFFS